jgi:hypothetical protein
MGTIVLADVTELNTVKLSELPQASSAGGTDILPIVKDIQTQKIEKDDYLKNSHFGDGTNYSYFEADGKLHFVGTARPVIFEVLESSKVKASHHNLLGITSLAAANGIIAEELDESTGVSQRIEVFGIGRGAHAKGRLTNSYSQGDTTDEGTCTQITLSTTNAAWAQAGEWRLILEITAGTLTGTFTIIMPPFTLLAYGRLELYVTSEGAVYFMKSQVGYYASLSGPNAASEILLNDEVAGPDIAIEVADTTGFYAGHLVFISDSENEEWARIKAISLNTSVTVDALTNPYTVANGAKLDIFDFTRTPIIKPTMRGMFQCYVFKAGENMGIQCQFAIPQSADPSSGILIVLQYSPSEDNVGETKTKWQLQYRLTKLGEDLSESVQYGTRVITLVTPPASKVTSISPIGVIPAAEYVGRYGTALKLIRLGRDAEDTYIGDIKFVAAVVSITHKQLGYET